ncbi:aminopeptidase [Lachnospiraceae bacterium]|jgi:aspartyl aminopeptidase|nr:aminopeptidase [uncultured Schaedlerella sp.]NBI57050.1 aminopeptidase [Lachnospiraceae bacterium]
MERKNAWNFYHEEDLAAVGELSIRYRRFLDAGKTERECAAEAVRMAREAGYQDLLQMVHEGETLRPGDKVYLSFMKKSAAFFWIGTDPLEEGMNIIGAHIDSPRLDLKQVPCYEEAGNVYLDTHYYGGIKKYQWFALPLALHGIIVRKDGTSVSLSVGEKEDDPVFVITDLLPHLGRERNEQKVKDFFDAEKMDLLIGNQPVREKDVKQHILEILSETYQIQEEDFLSAELEIVPAGRARECGMDRSMVLSYGQDDRSCAFAALTALLDTGHSSGAEIPRRTACCLLVDKEETGSNGATGMKSRFFENAVAEIIAMTEEGTDRKETAGVIPFDLRLRRALLHSRMLSADVSAAFDPAFEKYYEKKNSAYLGNGLVFNKYSGSGGKSGANDANPEYMAKLRRIMEESQVTIQTAELGAVDQGGGGTIAYIMAKYGMEVIDCGLAVLSMHAPWEVTSKADLYEAVKGYRAFYKKML